METIVTHNESVPFERLRRYGIMDTLASALVAVPAVCFSGALLTDLAYYASPDIQWANFSAWLLAVGIAFAGLALVVGLIARFIPPRRTVTRGGYLYFVAALIAMILSLFNNFVHSRDGWTSVVPTGLTLSALTVLFMVIAACFSMRSARLFYVGDAQ